METQINKMEFARGYDDAYWLAQIEPTIAETLRQEEIDIRDDYLSGFAEGLDHDRNQTILNDFQNIRTQSSEKDRDRDM